MAASTVVVVAASALVLAALLAIRMIENRRNDREGEPQMIKNKAFLAMMNRLPLAGQRLAWVDFNRGGYTEEEEAEGRVVLDSPPEESNVMTSLVDLASASGRSLVGADRTTNPQDVVLHRPVIDIDHRVTVIESSTVGHSHFYVDLMMPWEDLVKLLEVMAEIGLVEPGYVNASKARGYTAVRLPWISKGQLTDREVWEA